MPIITNRAGITYDTDTQHLQLQHAVAGADRIWYVDVIRACDGLVLNTFARTDRELRDQLGRYLASHRYPWDLVTAVQESDDGAILADPVLYGNNTVFCVAHGIPHAPAVTPMFCDNGRLMCRDGIPNRGTVEDLIGPRSRGGHA